MAGNLKLDSLRYGTLNNIAENGVHNSGDRRRTTTTTAINKALDKAYEKDTLLGVTEFNGIVVSYQEISYPTYRDRTSLLQEYIVANNDVDEDTVDDDDDDEGDAVDEPQEYANIAYKVYIPEIEPRPAPTGNNDPVLLSYPDVFSDVAATSPIPLGTIVVVRYEDKETLFNPRIVSYSDKAIGIENISVDAAGESLEIKFQEGRTGAIGEPMGPPAPREDQSDHVKEVYQPHTAETKELFKKALEVAGLPVEWADMPELHDLMNKESKGIVGIPNYTYMSVYSNVKQRSDTWPEIWDMARAGRGGKYKGNSTATGLGQLLSGNPNNVRTYYPDGVNGIGDAHQEAVGFVRYVAAAYGDPETAYHMHGKLGTYTRTDPITKTTTSHTKTFDEGY
jgi:hypothetical protein